MVEALAACNELCLLTYHKPVQTYETGETAIAEYFMRTGITNQIGVTIGFEQ